MKDIINEIIETEIKAKGQADALKEKEDQFLQKLNQELDEFKRSAFKHAEERILKTKEIEDQLTKNEIEQLNLSIVKQKEELENKFNENKALYVQKLFSSITGGE